MISVSTATRPGARGHLLLSVRNWEDALVSVGRNTYIPVTIAARISIGGNVGNVNINNNKINK